jgi:hypothetical protein
MCMACEMEAMWFAAMEARAMAAEAGPQAPLLPLPEGGRVGEGDAGGMRGADGEPAGPLANPEGGGGSNPPRFACEETQAE